MAFDSALSFIALTFPFFSLLVVRLYGGLIRYNTEELSRYPNALSSLLGPGCGLMIRGLLDFELLEYSRILIYTPFAGALIAVVCLGASRELGWRTSKARLNILLMTFLCCAYSYGAIVTANCAFGHQGGQKFEARILEKRVSDGKSTTYYLKLSPWGPRTQPEEVSVAKWQYEEGNVEDEVAVNLWDGVLGIPWFEVEIE
jgi:hypothetical protein